MRRYVAAQPNTATPTSFFRPMQSLKSSSMRALRTPQFPGPRPVRRSAAALGNNIMGSETNGWAVEKHGNRALVPLEQVKEVVSLKDMTLSTVSKRVIAIQALLNETYGLPNGSRRNGQIVDADQMLLELETSVRNLLSDLGERKQQLFEAESALQNAMLHAMQKLEDRVQTSFDKEWGEEKKAMQQALREARDIANDAIVDRDVAVAAAERKNSRMASDAVAALEGEVEAVVKLAQAAASLSASAAEEAGASSMRVVKQHAEAFAHASEVHEMAKDAYHRAEKAQSEAAALAKEVEILRHNLNVAQSEAATATRDAVEAEKRAGQRLQEALDEFARQQKEMENAYEMFKAGERDRRRQAEEQAREDRLRNEELSSECSHLRESLSAALEAVAQATAQAEEAQKTTDGVEAKTKKELAEAKKTMEVEVANMREQLYLEALARAQSAVKKDLKEAKMATNLASQSTGLRIESLEIALKRANSAKNKWQARAIEAEEIAGQLQIQLMTVPPSDGAAAAVRGRAQRYLKTGRDIRNFKSNGTNGVSIEHTSQAVQSSWTATDADVAPAAPGPMA
eukprot:CAMPEP_0177772086 /NCGR_PEP_ID=MMETSP0491_2-20121128/12009_1 /TAXON_ID=63592 /ORGANISM="Tetraselmis chuii, Strain PLY429" /LENGTH=570 /DNA_ID=CAMNT_0019289821 /DNA_START=125 /DNA_END=1838 /DNA_ORIENTATION=+